MVLFEVSKKPIETKTLRVQRKKRKTNAFIEMCEVKHQDLSKSWKLVDY